MTSTWRDNAACLDEDPELFHPRGTEGPWALVIRQAKHICQRCPVAEACLQFALDENIPAGIYGGLTERQRASIKRAAKRYKEPREALLQRVERVRQPRKPRTLQELVDTHTTPLYGGHLAWTGPQHIYVNGHKYTPKQAAFIAGRGHEPNGNVTSDCGRECFLPAHLADKTERAACGTSDGYLRHQRHHETACERCHQAHTNSTGAAA